MNRAFFFLILSIVFLAPAARAAAPDEVAGIRWDASSTQVRQTLAGRQGITFEAETPSALTFKGGTFAGFNVKSWRFTFAEGKMSSVLIAFSYKEGKDKKGWFADQDFAALQKLLEQKYGKATSSHDQEHQTRSWSFPDLLAIGAAKTIALYRGWGHEHNGLELTYTYKRADKGTKPALSNPKDDI